MLLSSILFATMGVFVKWGSTLYTTGEIVFYRGLFGMVVMLVVARLSGGSLRTSIPSQHFWRSMNGVASIMCWFFAIGQLPLATAMTLYNMASLWMALFVVAAALIWRKLKFDARLLGTVFAGFCGVILILQPSFEANQWFAAAVGMLSGLLTASAFFQIQALGRAKEPSYRIVFYFSLASVVLGGATMFHTGASPHTLKGVVILLGLGVTAALAQLFMTKAYSKGGALETASLQYSGIVFSLGYGLWLFNENLTVAGMIGVGIVTLAGLTATILSHRAGADKKAAAQPKAGLQTAPAGRV